MTTKLEAAILAIQLVCSSPTPEAQKQCAARVPASCAAVIDALQRFDAAPREVQARFSKSDLLEFAAFRRFRAAMCDTD